MKSASKELLLNTIIFAVGTLGAKMVMFVLLPIYTTYLTTGQLGAGELVVNCMNLIYPIATFNILSALLRYSMENKRRRGQVLQCTLIIVLGGLILAGIILHIVRIDSSIEQWKTYLFLLLISYTLEQIVSVFSKAIDHTLDFAIGNILYTVILLICSVVLIAGLHRGTAGYIEGMIYANVITFIYFCIRLDIKKYLVFKGINTILLKEMFVFSIPLIFNSISWWVSTFCDRLVLERVMNTSAVGLYSAASKFPAIITAVSSVFMQAWVLSTIKEYQSKTSRTFFASMFSKYSAFFILGTSAFLCICKPFVQLISRGEFSQSWKYVPLLVCGAVFSGYANFFAAFYTSAKKNNAIMITTFIGAVINLGLNIILIPKWGIQGAVFATMISQFIIAFYRMIDSRRIVRFKINYIRFILSIVLLVIQSVLILQNISILLNLTLVALLIFMYVEEIKVLFHHAFSLIRK